MWNPQKRMLSWALSLGSLLIFLLCPRPTEAQLAPDFVGVFTKVESTLALPHSVYDRDRDHMVLASFRPSEGFAASSIDLELTIERAGVPSVSYLYNTPLEEGSPEFEIAELLVDNDHYVVFINEYDDHVDRWSSWVVRIDAETMVVQWSRQLTAGVGETTFLRVRDAEVTGTGYAFVFALDDLLFDGETALALLDRNTGAVLWAREYQVDLPIELYKPEFGRFGLRVVGWVSDLALPERADVVLLEISERSGGLMNAVRYPGAHGFFDVGTVNVEPSPGVEVLEAHYLSAQTEQGGALFFPVNGNLQALPGLEIQINPDYFATEFTLVKHGGLVALMQQPSDGDLLLKVPGPFYSNPAQPSVVDLEAVPTVESIELVSLNRSNNGALVSGRIVYELDPGEVLRPLSTASLAESFPYCVPSSDLPPRQLVAVGTVSFQNGYEQIAPVTSSPALFIKISDRLHKPTELCE